MCVLDAAHEGTSHDRRLALASVMQPLIMLTCYRRTVLLPPSFYVLRQASFANTCSCSPPCWTQWSGMLLCTAAFYGEPLVYADVAVMSPMNRMLSMPHGKPFSAFGAIAVVPWMVLCNKATNMLCDAVVPTVVQLVVPLGRGVLAEERTSAASGSRTDDGSKKDL